MYAKAKIRSEWTVLDVALNHDNHTMQSQAQRFQMRLPVHGFCSIAALIVTMVTVLEMTTYLLESLPRKYISSFALELLIEPYNKIGCTPFVSLHLTNFEPSPWLAGAFCCDSPELSS